MGSTPQPPPGAPPKPGQPHVSKLPPITDEQIRKYVKSHGRLE